MKRFILIVLMIMLTISSLTGCTRLKEMYDKYQEYMQPYYDDMELALEYAEKFILAVANDDLETARTYLHPDISGEEGVPEGRIKYLEERYNMDFSDGVVIDHTIGTNIRINSHRAKYELGFRMMIGDVDFRLYFEVTRNSNGFGITNVTEVRPQYV